MKGKILSFGSRQYVWATVGAAVLAGMLLGMATPSEAQSTLLPDLIVHKGEPRTEVLDDGNLYYIYDDITVTNVGSGSATVLPGTVFLRDEMRVRGEASSSIVGGELVGGLGCCIDDGIGPIEVNLYSLSDSGVVYEGGPLGAQVPDSISPGDVRFGWFSSVGFYGAARNSGVIRNCVTVDPDNAIAESRESNNTDCVVTPLGTPST